MPSVRARYDNGALVLEEPLDLPEGTTGTVKFKSDAQELEPLPEMTEVELIGAARAYGVEPPFSESQRQMLRYFKWHDAQEWPAAPALPLEAYDRERLYP